MRAYRYLLLDVFTDRPFGGNPLAVFPEAQGLDPVTMQAIAKEFNLSETTFVLPPSEQGADFHVRIFTPATELPMAGHPTVGTAFVLAQRHAKAQQALPATLVLQEGVGLIPVTFAWDQAPAPRITMQQPLPTFGPRFDDWSLLATVLGLEEADLCTDLPAEVISCGVPFLFVPVKTLEAIQRIRLRQEIWQQAFAQFASAQLLVFTRQTQTRDAAAHCRMFAPTFGIAEDPATGAANGPLGCYLVRYGLVSTETDVVSLISEQGFEMGRPSLLFVTIEQQDRVIRRVLVAGHCVPMAEGVLTLV